MTPKVNFDEPNPLLSEVQPRIQVPEVTANIFNLKFKDDEFIQLQDEFQQIQECKGMYISYSEEKCALQLLKEIINNSVDELTAPECDKIQNKKIDIFVDEVTKEYLVSDNGRGIPFDRLIKIITEKHTSTKIGRRANRFSAGQNGVGLKIVVALSSYFCITSYRDGKMKMVEFHNCAMTEHPVKTIKKDIRGTYIKFVPNEKHIGEFELQSELVEDWVRRLSYLIPEGLSMKFIANKKGSEASTNKKYSASSLSDDVRYLSPSLEFSPIELEDGEEYGEDDEIQIKMAFSYDRSVDGELVDSYCDYIHTDENGYHVDGCRRAICNFLVREARQADANNKLEITYEDCKKGLILVVNCLSTQPQLKAQTKNAVENKDIAERSQRLMYRQLKDYFVSNQSLLKKIIAYLRQIVKLRLEVTKVRDKTVGKPTSFLDDAQIKGFWNISDRNYTGYRELYIVEGDK